MEQASLMQTYRILYFSAIDRTAIIQDKLTGPWGKKELLKRWGEDVDEKLFLFFKNYFDCLSWFYYFCRQKSLHYSTIGKFQKQKNTK